MSMRYGRIPGVEREVSRLIQGTLLFGWLSDDQARALLDAVYAQGCNAFDTALVYGAGHSQQLLGKWLRERQLRSSVVIIDKGCHPRGDVARVTPADLDSDVQRALENLGVDCIDLYLLHRDDPSLPVDEIVCALNEQRRRGRIAAFGGSNWTHERLQDAHDYATAHGLVPFAASSPGLSLARPLHTWPGCVSVGLEPDALAWYQSKQLPLLGWSPLASGFLSERFEQGPPAEPSAFESRVLEFYGSRENWARLARLRSVAARHGVSVAQAALAYVFHLPADVYAVLGCREAREFEALLEALELRFDAAEIAALEAEVPA
ncbi:MAG: aldo/keto reductase [Myxococcota bacterium]